MNSAKNPKLTFTDTNTSSSSSDYSYHVYSPKYQYDARTTTVQYNTIGDCRREQCSLSGRLCQTEDWTIYERRGERERKQREINDKKDMYNTVQYGRAAVVMGIPMGIPMGMGMVWVWGLWWIPMGSVGNLWGFLNGCNFCGIETNSTNSEFVFS